MHTGGSGISPESCCAAAAQVWTPAVTAQPQLPDEEGLRQTLSYLMSLEPGGEN